MSKGIWIALLSLLFLASWSAFAGAGHDHGDHDDHGHAADSLCLKQHNILFNCVRK